MNEILKQVSQAQRRLIIGQFFRNFIWAFFSGLLLAAIGIAIPKIWYLDFLQTNDELTRWNLSWIVGGSFCAILVSFALIFRQIQSNLMVAVAIDQRFKLKERLSSTLSLSPEELATPAGQALLQDAIQRAETIDVRDKFPFQPSKKAFLPVVPMALLGALYFIPNAVLKPIEPNSDPAAKKQMQLIIEEAKKKKEEKKQASTTKGLEEAKAETKSIERQFDALLEDKNSDKKNTLVKLNDIKKQIEDRKKAIGDNSELKENLNRLKDAAKGPAKELAEALGKGEMPEARKAIKELADKLKEGKLNEIEAKKLAQDLDAMAKEIDKMNEKKEQEKKDLENELKKAVEKGDLDKAAAIQEKIEKVEQQKKQMEKMKEMGDKLKKCAECMKEGNGQPKKAGGDDPQKEGGESGQKAQAQKDAARALEEMAEQLEKMQGEMEEMEDLEEMEKLAGQCKGCMNGDKDKEDWQDFADGEGRGGGKRAIEKDDTGGFKARVKGKVQEGETVVTGTADGENLTGRTSTQVLESVKAGMNNETDPLENQVLPKSQREHAQQYFESLRKNQ